MTVLDGILAGIEVAFSFQGILFVFIGVLLGTIIGMLPGLGPITAIGVMIPVSYGMDPNLALVMMAGIYYGAMFGGSTASILLNAPGVAGTVAAAFDGYPMALQGKAGKALAISAICSFIGGTISVVLLMLFAPLMAKVAIAFGPTEYFALMLFALTAITSLSDGSVIKALIAGTLGFMTAMIGIDSQTGTTRFTFGIPSLLSGIDFLIIALGLYALSEAFQLIVTKVDHKNNPIKNIGTISLTKEELKEISGPAVRQSFLGFIIGVLPGAGATIASFIAYITEKKLSKNPESFGKGAIKGLAAPETANNAATTGAFVPLLSLGIPGSGTTAVLLGALLVMGVQPGPLLVNENPALFWGIIISMYIGNIFLLIINLPLIPYFVKILKIPRPMLISLVAVFSLIGVYGISFNTFDLLLLLFFGVVGYFLRKLHFPAAPFILAFILGGMIERTLRQSLTISNGDYGIFLDRPISLLFLCLAALSLFLPVIIRIIKKMRQ